MSPHALIIDYGMSTVKAAAITAGTTPQLVVFDGQPWTPSAVHTGADGAAIRSRPGSAPVWPAAAFTQPATKTGDDPATLAAATLTHVHQVAQEQTRHQFSETILLFPPYCGPQWRSTLRRAATLAGLPAVRLTESATTHLAALAAAGAHLPGGAVTAICDLGAGATDITVMQNINGHNEILAAARTQSVCGNNIDMLLAAHLFTGNSDTATEPERVQAAQELKHKLSHLTAVFDPATGATVSQTTLQQITEPLCKQLASAVIQTAHDSGASITTWTGIYLRGGGAHLPGAAAALQQYLGIPVAAVAEPITAAVTAAAQQHTGQADPRPGAVARRTIKPAQLAVPLVLMTTSVVLYLSTLFAADVYAATYSTKQTIITAWSAYGLAAFTMLLAAAHTGHILAAAAGPERQTPQRRTNLVSGAVFAGLATAVIYGLTAQLYLEAADSSILAITLWCTAPAAAVLIGVQHLRQRLNRQPEAKPAIPAAATILAATGMTAITAGLSGDISIPGLDKPLWTILIWAGGGLCGIAFGLLLVRNRTAHLYACGTLAVIGMMLAGLSTRDTIGYTYVTAATLWIIAHSVIGLVSPPDFKEQLLDVVKRPTDM
jgi:actin-like ATPase involved in cell morphogenesis